MLEHPFDAELVYRAEMEPLTEEGEGPKRHGAARSGRLSASQRELYFWILREFAAARPPSGEATHAAATRLGVDLEDALAVLAREDLVHIDAAARPLVAYPFSATPRGHRVLID